MAISYPITLPITPGFRDVRMRPVGTTGVARSPFTFSRQVYEWQGDHWEGFFELPKMERATAAPWLAALSSLRGRLGTMLLGPVEKSSQASASGWTVNGANQVGTTLAVSAGSGTITKGDYLQLGSGSSARLHMALNTLTGSGSLDIFPRLRESPSNGSSVDLTSPQGIFALATDEPEWDIETKLIYGVRIDVVEAY